MRFVTRKRLIGVAVFIALTLLLLFSVDYYVSGLKSTPVEENTYEPEARYEFGIAVDSLIVIKDEIKNGDNLSAILLKHHVGSQDIEKLVQRSQGIFDVRSIRVGNSYTILCSNDSLQKARYMVYEQSPTRYVVFETGDSIHIHTGEKEVKLQTKTASGTISSSLWNAMMDAGASPNLAVAISEIYAWTIDFYAIQPGDNFTIFYEELSVEGEKIGIGNIMSARFYHGGKDNYAFRFIQDGVADYFDEKGQSLRKAFLKAPLKFSRISSRFSNSRLHPVLRIRRPHHGVDYAAPKGTPVHAVGSGTVTDVRYAGGAGRMVKIKHNATYTTAYLHLSGYGPGIKSGVRVSQGQVIGYVGSSGLSTGPHLDFRFYKNGTPVDPLKVDSPPALPVKKELLVDFNILRRKLIREHDSLNMPKNRTVMPI
ncbi:MAG: peptidoglycan DD-metalloendopeptidase family protein [Lentimicrobium sp.]|jgi:murein DD-endopeptidase MepM/ murein hydrolase activator NlpD|nr:peptidoglycan DD-metalloendopeptidase family protein [Lentimicrobium sp.]